MRIDILGLEEGLARQVQDSAATAGQALSLADHLEDLEIWADDLEGEDQAWFRCESGSAADRGRRRLLLFCAAGSFCRVIPAGLGRFLPREVWEQAPLPRSEDGGPLREFAPERAARFLHHNLLLAIDLVSGVLTPTDLPAGQVEAFQALWAATVDGRLARSGLPHYDLAARRSRFSGLFSAAGVLLPDHWQMFQSLWDGGVSTQKEVLELCRLLPRL